jgi:hypothetical protein
LDPTASQKVAEIHDTPPRLATLEGRVWFVQAEPFHESAAPTMTPLPRSLYPTASQKVAETHDTSLRKYTPEGREAVSFTQVEPPSVVS